MWLCFRQCHQAGDVLILNASTSHLLPFSSLSIALLCGLPSSYSSLGSLSDSRAPSPGFTRSCVSPPTFTLFLAQLNQRANSVFLVLAGNCSLCFQAQRWNPGCTVPSTTARARAVPLFFRPWPRGVLNSPSYGVVPFNFHRLFVGSSPSTPSSRPGSFAFCLLSSSLPDKLWLLKTNIDQTSSLIDALCEIALVYDCKGCALQTYS